MLEFIGPNRQKLVNKFKNLNSLWSLGQSDSRSRARRKAGEENLITDKENE